MRHLFFLKAVFLFLLLNERSPVALSLGIDHFNVTLSPSIIKSGEALDLSIEAVDKNDNVVKDYVGNILVFSETDSEADFPTVLRDSSYQFEIADEGSVTFENAVVFKNAGTQSLSIYDLDDDTIWWEASVEVTEKQIIKDTVINILSPEDRVTLGGDEVVISGTTKKNHAVKITIDDSTTLEAISDSDGIFEVTAKELIDGEHTILAHVLDADKNITGESEQITIEIDASLPVFKSFDAKPDLTELEPQSEIEVIVLATRGITKVQVILNDTIEVLGEVSDGMYTKVINVPEEAGSYTIDVYLEDELSHNLKIQWVETLEVKALEAAPVVVVWDEPNNEETPTPEPETEEVERDPLLIKNLKLVELKTKSILSWDVVKMAESYNVYKVLTDETGEPIGKLELIDTVTNPQIEVPIVWDEIQYDYFAVKAQAKTGSGEELYEWDLSEAAKIKTGPQIYILLLISILVGGLLFFNKRQA